MKKNIVIEILLVIFLFSACTNESGVPNFISEDDEFSVSASESDESAINERLAGESGIKHFVYHVGPVDLPVNTKLEDSLEQPLKMNFMVNNSSWIIAFKPKVINALGEELPNSLLFQAIVYNKHDNNPLCSEGGKGNPFFASNSILTDVELPSGYGYPILNSDPLEVEVILYNPTDIEYVDVSFELDIVTRQMNELNGLKDIKPMLLDLNPCTHEPMDIEPMQFVERQATFTVPSSGKLLFGVGILQDFGAFVELYKSDAATPFWRTEGLLDENSYLQELINNPFNDPEGEKFKEEDTITLGVAYENTKDSWLRGASAAAMIYYAIDEE